MNSPARSVTHAQANTSANPNASAPPFSGSKTLWAATLVLLVVVLALGGTLIRIQSQPVEPRMSVLPQPNPAAGITNDGAASIPVTGSMPETPAAASAAVSAAATPTASAAVGATMANPAVPGKPDVIKQNKPQALIDKAQEATKGIAYQAVEITDKPRPVLPRQPEPAVLRPPGVAASSTATPASR